MARAARAAVLLLSAVAIAFGQNPTPAQGRDAGPPVTMRVVKVDSQGRLMIAPGSGGCVGTVATPCNVAGTAADGAAPTQPPVLVGGSDGTLTRTIKTDTAGQLIPSNASSANADAISNTTSTETGAAGATLYWRNLNYLFNGITWDRMRGNTSGVAPANASAAAADGVSNTQLGPTDAAGVAIYARVLPFHFTGSTWDRELGCTSSIIFDGSTSGNTQIIAASGATQVRICKATMTAASSVSLQFKQGTGSNCAVGTADMSLVYQNVLGVTEDYLSDRAPLTAAASQAVCINLSATVRVTGQVWYAQF
jgi:hypothetical protein